MLKLGQTHSCSDKRSRGSNKLCTFVFVLLMSDCQMDQGTSHARNKQAVHRAQCPATLASHLLARQANPCLPWIVLDHLTGPRLACYCVVGQVKKETANTPILSVVSYCTTSLRTTEWRQEVLEQWYLQSRYKQVRKLAKRRRNKRWHRLSASRRSRRCKYCILWTLLTDMEMRQNTHAHLLK